VKAVHGFAASEVARDPLGEATQEDLLRLISLELAAARRCVIVWELGRGFEAA